MGSLLATDADASSPARACRLLLIEDQPVDARVVQARLAKCLLQPEVEHVATLADALRALDASSFDGILLDLGLPDGGGLPTVRRVLMAAQKIPVIVLTGEDDHALAAEAVQLGAQDYLVKGEFDSRQLANSIRFAMERNLLLRQLEEARNQENEVRDRFLSHVSHELRTPLSAVMQFVGILRDGIAGPLNDEQKRCLGTVQRNVKQLRQMIGSLMDVTRAGVDQLSCHGERVRAPTLVGPALEAVQAQAATGGVSLHTEVKPDLPVVVADPVRIGQVLINLLANAIKFSPAGGVVTIEVDTYPQPPGPGAGGREIVVSVRDQGRGIPPSDLERVFERLVQLEPSDGVGRKGLGLGLFLSREIVRRHGGRIWAESKRGEGSAFRFTLPCYDVGSVVGQVLPAGSIEALSMIRVAVHSQTATSRAVGLDAVMSELAGMLEAAMVGTTDRPLPSRRLAPDLGTVVGLARCGERGALAIEERLAQSIDDHPRWSRWGFRIVVGTATFAPAGASQQIEAVEAAIEDFEHAVDSGSDPDMAADHSVLQPISPHIYRGPRTGHLVRKEDDR